MFALLIAVLLAPVSAARSPTDGKIQHLSSAVVEAPVDFDPARPGALAELAGFAIREVESIDRVRHPLDRPAWYLLRLERTADPAAEGTWLHLSALHQRRTSAFLIADGRVIRTVSAGYGAQPGGREWSDAGLDLALPLGGAGPGRFDVLLGVEAAAPPLFTPQVVGTDTLHRRAVLSWSVCFLYYGGVFFISLVQVVLMLHFRDRVTRDYAIFAAGMCLGALARYGHFDALLGPHLGGFFLGDYLLQIRCLNTVLGLRAMMSFFDLRVQMPRMAAIARATIGAHLLLLVASPLVGPSWTDAFSAPLRMLTLAFAAVVCTVAIRRKLIGAPVATLAWGGVIFTDMLLMAMLQGWLPRIPNAPMLTIVGILWEMVFNTFALVYRFDRVRDLRQRMEIKESESRSFQRLLRVLCHDVSNPLSAIRFTLDALDPRSPFRAAHLELPVAVQRMRQAEATITAIIQNVRAQEALGLYGGSVPTKPVDLVNCIEETIELFDGWFVAKAIRVEREFEAVPRWVEAEPSLLKSTILSNALSNALKFSPHGGVLRITIGQSNPDRIRVRIADRGAGIPPELLRAFPVAGAIASQPGTGGEVGTGFGLRLMRDYLELMGGRLTLRSVSAAEDPQRCGTTVEIELRSARPPEPTVRPSGWPAPSLASGGG